ncbi:MAG: class I SAM-dependent methyltransferase [Streptomyces sp.]|nr:class I SAM-dependent methyltransferase [Streptomyces sp.]
MVYLPCCGTLRHARPLLARESRQVVGVDLSGPSLAIGLARTIPMSWHDRVTVFRGDIRDAKSVLPTADAEFAFLGGNSLGDVTAPDGHLLLWQGEAEDTCRLPG